jgi:hypothetical protein
MTRLSKTSLIAAAFVAMTGTAFADDPAVPSGDPAGGGAAPPAGGAPATMAGGKGSKIVGADVVGILPLGDYSDGVDFALGAVGRFEYGVTDEIAVTGRAGYIYNFGTPDGVTLSMIPLLVGGTYKIGTSGLFVQAELGITNIRASVDVQGTTITASDTKFSIGGGVGYQKDKIKARVGFFMPGSEDGSDGNGGTTTTTLYGILASVGYDFVAL